MTCYRPNQAWQHSVRKGRLIFSRPNKAFEYDEFTVPCGKCVGCRLDYSRQWAVRCYHEASLYEDNCFITLTYAPEHLPEGGTLVKEHFVLFMKRLREKFARGIRDEDGNVIYQKEEKIRVFYCGEYGGKYGRPHYHALLFNVDFPDKTFWRNSQAKAGRGKKAESYKIYRSKILEELWPYGNCEIGSVSFESAAYVARYMMKKVKGKNAAEHYRVVDPITFEIFDRLPEFAEPSRNPGIGRPWLEKYHTDIFPDDSCTIISVKGKTSVSVPRYYSNWFKVSYPDDYERIKEKRVEKVNKAPVKEKTFERLAVREKIQVLKLEKLIRDKVD